jgi:methionine synthase I (cobalamin-dependent)
MSHKAHNFFAERPVVVADGGMGTNLFRAGLAVGAAPELWNAEQPQQVRAVHQAFVDAGADVVLTNSFGGNRRRLGLYDAQERVAELNRAAARLAREVADAAPREVLVAGSLGPTGELFEPLGALSRAEGLASFAEQADALAEGGCDLLWIETIAAAEELEVALTAAAGTGLPVVATMSFDCAGRTMMGVAPAEALALSRQLPARPLAFGANCGTGPAEMIETVVELARAAAPQDLIVAKSNCGIPEYREGRMDYGAPPAVMAAYACLARDAGARVIGGCCGTTPAHTAAMARALGERPRCPSPGRTVIEARLGPLGERKPGPRRERRTRRRGA